MRSVLSFTLFLLLGMPLLAAGEGAGDVGTPSAFEASVRAHAREVPEEVAEALLAFYEARGFQPAWFSQGRARPEAHRYLAALCEVEAEGLRPERYHRAELDAALERPGAGEEEDAWVPVELRLTSSFLTYASHLLTGQVSPKRFRWRTQPPERELAEVLEAALASGDIAGSLRALSPRHEGFRQLQAVLARYRAIAAAGGWPQVPRGAPLERGVKEPRVGVLRERLRISGELPSALEERRLRPEAPGLEVAVVEEGRVQATARASPAAAESEELFDETLEEAVKHFQRRHGLEEDGVVGARTLAALRVPVEERIEQIVVNLERWRWVPRELGARHVLVNLPAFELEAVEKGRAVLRMRVIIGARSWRTPVFQDEVKYLVLNPVWHVPGGISSREVLPKLREDPREARRMGLRVRSRSTGEVVDPASVDWNALEGEGLPYRFEHPPGPTNPLGRVKFIFPNDFSVYLHDTPDPKLFERAHRALSHGCIRVEEPARLAAFLLRGHEGWTVEALEEAMAAGGEPRRVELPEPVPVHLLYWTAFVDAEGRVNFRPDLYQRDGPVSRALGVEPLPSAHEVPASCGRRERD
jgi:L,D-transpeptidase YcbB